MLQPRQVLIGLLARQPIHLVDVVDVSLVDLPSFELFIAQVVLVLLCFLFFSDTSLNICLSVFDAVLEFLRLNIFVSVSLN